MHYAVLRRMLKQLYQARHNNQNITAIDKVLPTGNYKELMKLLHFDKFEKVFKMKDVDDDNDCADTNQVKCSDVSEEQLLLKNEKVIKEHNKQLEDDPGQVCCSCQQLHQRKSVTQVTLLDDIGNVVWPS